MLKTPKKIEYILTTLCQNGYEAYIVGGCVRDSLLGFVPNDYDITTSAKPEQVIELFERTIPTGIKHGTVTVVIEKEPIEVTTFRTEGNYTDSRRPDSVEFVSDLKEDLSRRDFTVNALAYSHTKGLIDYFGGEKDLKNRILRAVGDPKKRFGEDALRILRLFRFASQLDFSMEQNTLSSALELSENLKNISRERIFSELLKTICGKEPKSLEYLLENGALSFLGIKGNCNFDILKNLKNENLCLFSFLKDTAKNPLMVLEELNASNAQKKYVTNLFKLTDLPLFSNKTEIKNALFETDKKSVTDMIFYLKSKGENTENAEKMLEEILLYKEPFLVKHLALSGEDIKTLGFSGKEIGEKLEFLREIVVKDPIKNNKKDLKNFLMEFEN